MSDSQQIEKSISEQIIERMIVKLNSSEFFPQGILTKIEDIDLKNKAEVYELISKTTKDTEDENSKTGN